MNILTAAICNPACPLLALAGRQPRRRMADRTAQSACRQLRGSRRRAAPYVHVPAEFAGRPAAGGVHPRRKRQSARPDGSLAATAGRPGRDAVLDRPGHGWSGAAKGNEAPADQANDRGLMDHYGMREAIIVGHSFGGSVAPRFALNIPRKTQGLVFLSPATHPWPGGKTSWYYKLTVAPVLGWMFVGNACWPRRNAADGGGDRVRICAERGAGGLSPTGDSAGAATKGIPGTRPMSRASTITSPVYAKRYPEIKAPTVVITGDATRSCMRKSIRWGCARHIAGAELVWVKNLGHKPDWIAPDLVVAAIEKLGGQKPATCRRWQGRLKRGSPATVSPPAVLLRKRQVNFYAIPAQNRVRGFAGRARFSAG
jgi:pimeloyl-ACP methyl ester carboxylesterase